MYIISYILQKPSQKLCLLRVIIIEEEVFRDGVNPRSRKHKTNFNWLIQVSRS